MSNILHLFPPFPFKCLNLFNNINMNCLSLVRKFFKILIFPSCRVIGPGAPAGCLSYQQLERLDVRPASSDHFASLRAPEHLPSHQPFCLAQFEPLGRHLRLRIFTLYFVKWTYICDNNDSVNLLRHPVHLGEFKSSIFLYWHI